jgi:pyruvate dehydrogenase E2 component (dihydrolipoamide acetyltransferase)
MHSLSLTFDHRITDGADAARLLAKVVRYLEDQALLLIESVWILCEYSVVY